MAEKSGLAKVLQEIRPMLILLCLTDELKKQQKALLKDEPSNKSEWIASLFGQLSGNHDKLIEGAANIHKQYTTKWLEMNTVEELIGCLGVPASAMEPFLALDKLVVSQ